MGAFAPESRESIKTNELRQDSAQRFTTALRAVFSPQRAVRVAPASHGPKRKPFPVSHADFLLTIRHRERPSRLKLKRTRGKTKQRPTFARFSPAKSRNAPAFALRA